MSETHTSSPIVVVGCDGSDTARAALALAAEHARSGGKLFCVHAYAMPDGWMTPRAANLMLQEGMRRGEEVLEEARAAAEAVLDRDAIETELIGGNAAKVIADVATVRGADEIIVGTRGFGRARALLGSVSHELIHLAPCPVTVIPERVADRAAAGAEGSGAAAP